MDMKENLSGLMFFIIMIIFKDYEDTKAHKFLEQRGISQKIEQFEQKWDK